MTVRSLDHVQLAMPAGGEERATSFYEVLLGIPRVAKPAHLAKRGGCWFEAGDVRIHLGVDADFRPARKAHPSLVVDGLSALVTKLASAGIAVTNDQPLDGYERVYVDDPFGNRIELMEPACG
jgi:catechol 2,3-dioxygenase-like lactoylglutathione lyase family enzyme